MAPRSLTAEERLAYARRSATLAPPPTVPADHPVTRVDAVAPAPERAAKRRGSTARGQDNLGTKNRGDRAGNALLGNPEAVGATDALAGRYKELGDAMDTSLMRDIATGRYVPLRPGENGHRPGAAQMAVILDAARVSEALTAADWRAVRGETSDSRARDRAFGKLRQLAKRIWFDPPLTWDDRLWVKDRIPYLLDSKPGPPTGLTAPPTRIGGTLHAVSDPEVPTDDGHTYGGSRGVGRRYVARRT
jgi:hypothetical protein